MSNSNLIFVLDKPASGDTGSKGGGGLEFPKPFKSYKAEVMNVTATPVPYKDKTTGEGKEFVPIKLMLKGIDFKSDEYTCLEVSKDSKVCIEVITKWYNAIVASNESMKGAIGNETADLSKIANKGLQIGVTFMPGWQDAKFAKPTYVLSVNDVEDAYFNEAKYNEWKAQYWPENGGAAKTSAPVNQAQVVEDDLPF